MLSIGIAPSALTPGVAYGNPAASDHSAEPDDGGDTAGDAYRGYDRVAIQYPDGGLALLMARLPSQEGGGALAVPIGALGVQWRPNSKFAFGPRFEGGFPLLMGRAGLAASVAAGGWGRSGFVYTAGLYFGRVFMNCEAGEEGCDAHRGGTSGTGPQLSIGADHRWSMGDGSWGIHLGAAIETAWLSSGVERRSGFHLGVSAPRFGIDF